MITYCFQRGSQHLSIALLRLKYPFYFLFSAPEQVMYIDKTECMRNPGHGFCAGIAANYPLNIFFRFFEN